MCEFNMKNTVRTLVCVFLCLAALGLAAGCDDKQAQQQMPLPQVGIKALQIQSVPSVVELAGRVSSQATAEVRPQVSGIILQRMFTEGANVIAGQQLYQIDPAIYQAQYDTAVANQIKAQTAVNNAKKIYDRYREIIKVKGVSQQEYDSAEATYSQGVADLAAANAAVKTAKINLDYTKVYSPVSGRAGISSVTEGALVTSGQMTPLVYVQQMDPMYIDITQSSAEFLRLQRALMDGSMLNSSSDENGKQVDVLDVSLTLEDGKPYEKTAKMMLYDATVDQTTGSITMRAVVDNPDHLLLPGMFVRAKVTEGIIGKALLVPLACVQRTPRGEAQVMIVNAEGKVEERIIESNRIYNNEAWIVLPGKDGNNGLEEGDKLILEGLNRVRAGMPAGTYEAGTKPAPEKPIPTAPKE